MSGTPQNIRSGYINNSESRSNVGRGGNDSSAVSISPLSTNPPIVSRPFRAIRPFQPIQPLQVYNDNTSKGDDNSASLNISRQSRNKNRSDTKRARRSRSNVLLTTSHAGTIQEGLRTPRPILPALSQNNKCNRMTLRQQLQILAEYDDYCEKCAM
ncbi:hypothetical protein BX616_009565, partial [Lobosporangium transversale]